jgi:spore coat protein CotH
MLKKNYTLLIILFIIVPIIGLPQDFYDIGTINTIEITFQESNWDFILDRLYADGNEERLTGAAIINGEQFDSVGVRYKGNSSYRPNQIKNPLNIKLDHIIEDQKLENYGTLKLANVYKDPSFVREVLSYEFAQKYMPASKANYINVYINSNHLGLYTSVQSVDKFFMRTHFSGDENPRFKGELTSSMPTLTTVWGYFDMDSASYFDYYELKSDNGWTELIGFLDTLNNNNSYVEEVLNVDRHLWMLAFDNLLVNLDAPINFAHNYYLYQDDAGRFNAIVWDLNENFGGFSMLLNGGPLSVTQMQQLDPFLNSSSSSFPIISKILSNSTYKKMYVAHMKTLIEENFSNNWFETRALDIQSIIDADVQNDPNKFYTYNDFLININNSAGGGPPPAGQPIVGITQLMNARVTYLNSQPEFQAAAPQISNIYTTPAAPSPYSTVWFNAEISNATSVMLAYRSSITNQFDKTEMFDDGNHNDGSAGDGIYGVSVSISANDVQYYFYAENNDAAKFLPKRAEYEYYLLAVTGDVVINEFMADNDTTLADQDGEYDDWIELYNNTGSDLSLNGYFLSDDGTDLTQWALPDTFIAANSFLIVWADDDEGQTGLHANFKLSKSGEGIYLVLPDTQIVDEIGFGSQPTDSTTGRYPDGTGSFELMFPSFSAPNQSGVTGIVDEQQSELPNQFKLEQNFPNPFNPTTTIGFSLPNAGKVKLTIYNILGEQVSTLVNEDLPSGDYKYAWNATNLPSGIYYYSLNSDSFSETKKMILLK